MRLLETLITSGRIVDIALVLLALETILLWIWHRARTIGRRFPALFSNAGAGAALLLALRAAITDAGWQPLALFLAAGLALHLVDVRARWRSAAMHP